MDILDEEEGVLLRFSLLIEPGVNSCKGQFVAIETPAPNLMMISFLDNKCSY